MSAQFESGPPSGKRPGREDGVSVAATVGLTDPAWAAAEDAGSPHRAGTAADTGPSTVAGTVNIIAALACRLTDAALVNAVMTVYRAVLAGSRKTAAQ
jgi:adenosylcobinamide hydrolase